MVSTSTEFNFSRAAFSTLDIPIQADFQTNSPTGEHDDLLSYQYRQFLNHYLN